MALTDTIYALSSGGLPSGVAVVRISGRRTQPVLSALCGDVPTPRIAALKSISDSETKTLLIKG